MLSIWKRPKFHHLVEGERVSFKVQIIFVYLFTEFVHQAIKKIFSLYKTAEVKPKTIVLLGHSMVRLILFVGMITIS